MVEDAPVGLLERHLGDLGAPDEVGGVVLGADRVDLLDGLVDEGCVGRRGGVVGCDVGGEERGAGGSGEERREGGAEDSHGCLSSGDFGGTMWEANHLRWAWRRPGRDAVLYTSEDGTDRGVVVSFSAFQWVDA